MRSSGCFTEFSRLYNRRCRGAVSSFSERAPRYRAPWSAVWPLEFADLFPRQPCRRLPLRIRGKSLDPAVLHTRIRDMAKVRKPIPRLVTEFTIYIPPPPPLFLPPLPTPLLVCIRGCSFHPIPAHRRTAAPRFPDDATTGATKFNGQSSRKGARVHIRDGTQADERESPAAIGRNFVNYLTVVARSRLLHSPITNRIGSLVSESERAANIHGLWIFAEVSCAATYRG